MSYNFQPATASGLPPGAVLMPRPQPIPGVPPGLEYLTSIDQLLIHQQVELLEVFTGWEFCNKYQIKNTMGQQVFFAAEESDTCMRQCCGSARGFIVHITDNFGQEVIRVTREFKCCAGCCWCADSDICGYELRVEAPVGNVCGYVRQLQSGWSPRYALRDATGEDVLYVEGPCCVVNGICCTWDQEFKVLTRDRANQVGVVSKQWSGLVREYFTDATNFNASFPIDLDVRMKAVVLSAAFLIDFMFFEGQKNDRNR